MELAAPAIAELPAAATVRAPSASKVPPHANGKHESQKQKNDARTPTMYEL